MSRLVGSAPVLLPPVLSRRWPHGRTDGERHGFVCDPAARPRVLRRGVPVARSLAESELASVLGPEGPCASPASRLRRNGSMARDGVGCAAPPPSLRFSLARARQSRLLLSLHVEYRSRTGGLSCSSVAARQGVLSVNKEKHAQGQVRGLRVGTGGTVSRWLSGS